MSEDVVRSLIIKIDKMAIDLAVLLTKSTITETQDLKEHAKFDEAICDLKKRQKVTEDILTQWTGNKILILWIISTAIAIYAAIKR